ncbi:MAG: ECF transporter S component [Firmicutes bacterium]|nr:ECF transporter S component [Bacillota bacterium]
MNEKTKNVAFLGLMLAVTLILFFVRIPIPTVSLALFLIPVFVTAQVKGIKLGIIAGLTAGMLSFIVAWAVPAELLSFAFQNPIVSVIPRILVGLVASATYLALKDLFKRFKKAPTVLSASYTSALLAVITNSALVLTALLLFYNGKNLGDPEDGVVLNFKWIMAVVVSLNTLIEIIVIPLVTAPAVYAISKVMQSE